MVKADQTVPRDVGHLVRYEAKYKSNESFCFLAKTKFQKKGAMRCYETTIPDIMRGKMAKNYIIWNHK